MTDLGLRDPDWPRTHIRDLVVDLNTQRVHITWAGEPRRSITNIRCSTGRGTEEPDRERHFDQCLDARRSNVANSHCTPIGRFVVQDLADALNEHPECRFVTWFYWRRRIAFHSHSVLRPRRSAGCVRVALRNAQMIHNKVRPTFTTVRVVYDPSEPALHTGGARW